MGSNIPLTLDHPTDNVIDILVENLGRINYGASLVSCLLYTSFHLGFDDQPQKFVSLQAQALLTAADPPAGQQFPRLFLFIK